MFGVRFLLIFLLADFCFAYELEDAIFDSLKNNNNIIAIREQIKSAKLASKLPLSDFMPTVSFVIGMDPTLQPYSAFSRNSSVQLSNPNFSLILQQNLFNSGRSTLKLQKALYDYYTKESSSYNEINNIVLSVISTYLEMLKANEAVSLYEGIVSAMTRHLDAEKKKFELGEINKSDLAKAQSKLSSTKAQYIQALSNKKNIMARFVNLTGKQTDNLNYPKINLNKIPNKFDQALEIARKNNLNLKAAYSMKKSLELARSVEARNTAPTLDLKAQLVYGPKKVNEVEDGTQQIAKSVALNLTVPLFQGTREYIGIAAAHGAFKQGNERYKSIYKTLQEELTIAWNDYNNSKSIIDATNDMIKANQIALDAIKQEAKFNIKTGLDVIDGEIELLKSRIQLISDKNAQLNALYRMLSLIYGNAMINEFA